MADEPEVGVEEIGVTPDLEGRLEVVPKSNPLSNPFDIMEFIRPKISPDEYDSLWGQMTAYKTKIRQLEEDNKRLRKGTRKIQRTVEQLEQAVTTDGLTGTSNRTYFDTILGKEVSRANRHKRPLSLIMLDIDFFKRINDTYGHQAGDYVLKELVKVVQSQMRGSDILARYGGEEFVAVLPETSIEGAEKAAEKIRRAIAEHEFVFGDRKIPVTLSAGVSSYQVGTADELVLRADMNLYGAKALGRDCVVTDALSQELNIPGYLSEHKRKE